METQCKKIVDYIMEHGSITSLDAYRDLGCHRLAARIADLRKEGYEIVSARVKVKNRFGEECSVSEYKIQQPEDARV